ncbi:DNA helicase [Fusarium sporotrichioides]|uniref:DNA helicase n=1 Tax=Fusarium sporotrichioides TaxID=5514 RepID=A0A395ST54_FUSSP|nr:DNA helicase [Fusarium sporotrichioides]
MRAGLNAADIDRIKFKTIDNAQGDEADYVTYDMVTTSTPAFVAAEFRNTLGLSRATAFLVILVIRGNFIGLEVNTALQLGANKRIA